MNRKKELLGSLCIIAAATLFGLMPLMTKIAYAYGSNAVTVAFWRFFFGALIAGIVVGIFPSQSFLIPREKHPAIGVLSLLYALTPILLYQSYQYLDSGVATTFHFSYPILVVILMALFLRNRFRTGQIISVILCFLGIILLHLPGSETSGVGIVFALLSGLTYALYVVCLGQSHLQNESVLTATFWISLFSCMEIGLFGLVTRQLIFQAPLQAWISYAMLGIFATVFALTLFQKGVFLCGGFKAALLSTFEPLTGVFVGILVFHEKMSAVMALGVVLVLGSGILLVLTDHQHNQKEKSNGVSV